MLFFLTGNDLATVLLQYSAFLCVTSFFPLAPVGFINAFILSHSAHFYAFYAVIPDIFFIFVRSEVTDIKTYNRYGNTIISNL